MTKSGAVGKPIVLAAYGAGNKPVVSGFTILSNWVKVSDKIYECNAANLSTRVNVLLVNGIVKAVGRYPNINSPNKGYLSFEKSTGNTQIKDLQLGTYPNWTNGEVVIRKNRWVVDRNLITLHSGNLINYVSQSHYAADSNFGYFIQNQAKTLDLDGEWYYTSASKRVGVLFESNNPSLAVVKASMRDTLVGINRQSNIVFNGIAFEGANGNAFEIYNSNTIQISNCDILFSGINAINASRSNGITLENSFISYTNNIAVNLSSCSSTLVKNNKIKYTGIFAGMGNGDSGSYEGIMVDGNNNTVEQNEIDSTGYIPITFSGDTVTIENNFINNFAFVKDDGGGIYTYNGFSVPKVTRARTISGNIILNGIGAGAGTTDTVNLPVSGIYLDDKVNNVEVLNNTVAGCSKYGIFIHNTNTVTLKGNTVFDNHQQLGLVHDKVAPNDPVKNVRSFNNILFSKDPAAMVAEYKTIGDDLQYFGSFDSNYYCRPFDDNVVLNLAYNNGVNINKQTDLAGWSAMYGMDKNSKKSPFKVTPYTIQKLIGANKYGNGNFAANTGGLYCWAAAGNCTVLWANNILDSGCLKVSFSKITSPNNHASVIIGVGAVENNKTYVLRFSLKGSNEHKSMQAYLRKSLSDYKDVSERKYISISGSRTESEIVFTASSSQSAASIVFDITEQLSAIYFDNIKLYEATVVPIDPEKYIRFEYNPGPAKKLISLSGSYKDMRGKTYTGSFYLEPYTSIILLKQADNRKPAIQTSPAYTFRSAEKAN